VGVESRPRRPFGLWLLTLGLLASPLIHGGALLLHAQWLNFGSLRPWDAFVYFLIAPIVGMLMLRRHERPASRLTCFSRVRSCERPASTRSLSA
jgi:hypothetical protein